MRNVLKRNDGYVLPYVLIVFLVLSFVAVSICSISLSNLRAQEASIARTQDLYEAEGEMEVLVAQLCELTVTGEDRQGEGAADASAVDSFWPEVKNRFGDESCFGSGSYTDEVTLTASSSNHAVTVTATLQVKLDTEAHLVAEGTDLYKSTASVDAVDYSEYNIFHSDAEGGDGT